MRNRLFSFIMTSLLISISQSGLAESSSAVKKEMKLPEFSDEVIHQGTKKLKLRDCETYVDGSSGCELIDNHSSHDEVSAEVREDLNNKRPFQNRVRSGNKLPTDEPWGRNQGMQ
jgi:hypothetical protein